MRFFPGAACAAVAFVALLASATGQSPRLAPNGTKVIVHDRAAVAQTVAGGGRIVADYETPK